MKTVKYELRFKIEGFPWRTFDTYTNKSDPELIKYAAALKSTKFNNGVKLIKIELTQTEVDL